MDKAIKILKQMLSDWLDDGGYSDDQIGGLQAAIWELEDKLTAD